MEVEDVLAALKALIGTPLSPVVLACLESVHDDIAFLSASDDAAEAA